MNNCLIANISSFRIMKIEDNIESKFTNSQFINCISTETYGILVSETNMFISDSTFTNSTLEFLEAREISIKDSNFS